MNKDIKKLFESWGKTANKDYIQQQWLLSKWEVIEGVVWPQEKIEIMIGSITEGLELKKKDHLVDLGCGGGWILKALLPKIKYGLGLDFSLPMLEKAKAFSPQQSFICGEIGKLPFENESFDKALSYFVFLNFMDDRFVEEAILDIIRVLKKGGKALIGQLPDKTQSSVYDRERDAYFAYCQKNFKLGKSHRDICRAPQKLFDQANLESFLMENKISYSIQKSFNPFYRDGQSKTIDWRFDLILRK